MPSQFRGVVIGSTWRLVVRMHAQGAESRQRDPRGDGWLPQVSPLEPLVRRALLYFDRIEWPNNNALPMGEIPDAALLEQSGVLHREMRVFADVPPPVLAEFLASTLKPGSLMGASGDVALLARQITEFHFDTFRKLERESPGCWALATMGQGLDVLGAAETRGVEIALHDALPVPMAECPYEEILKFKGNREAELLAFRAHMDELYLQVIGSPDAPRAQQSALHNIDKSLAAVSRTLRDSSIKFALETLRIDVSVGAVRAAVASAAAATGSAAMSGLPLLHATMTGLGAAAGTLVLNNKDVKSPVQELGAFKYVYEATREAILPYPAANPDVVSPA